MAVLSVSALLSCMIFQAISDCLGGLAMGMLKVSLGISGVFCISDSISRTECTQSVSFFLEHDPFHVHTVSDRRGGREKR